jgi:hypothetical protein
MPASLALPIDVRIERLGVAQIDWRVGANGGTIRGLEFGYEGGGTADIASRESRSSRRWARSPAMRRCAPLRRFALAGQWKAKGDAALEGIDADIALQGSLSALTLDVIGVSGAAKLKGRVSLAPLAARRCAT